MTADASTGLAECQCKKCGGEGAACTCSTCTCTDCECQTCKH